MGILSTNHKLINLGYEYSAGENIGISDDYVISSKDWSEEISQATSSVSGDVSALSAAIDYVSANAGHEYIGISPIGVDNSTYTISADSWVFSAGSGISLVDDNANKVTRIDVTANGGDVEVENLVKTNSGSWNTVSDKLDATAFTNWQDGQYATDLQTIEGQISNKLDTSSFSDVSGSFLTAINIPESATWNEVSQAYEQNSGTYLTSISIPESAVWQDVSTTVQTNSAQWSDNTGDEEVNSFVYNNSATINEVNTSYQTNSGNFLTAVNIPESANWDDTTNVVQTNSADWASHQDLSYISGVVNNKLDESAFANVSGTFLTAHQDLSDYQTIEGMTAYQPVGSYATTNDLEQVSADITATIPSTAGLASESYVQTNSAVLTAMIAEKQDTLTFGYDEQDRISAINNSAIAAGDEFPASANEAITAYQNASGTYLTAISIPESATWNDVSTTVQTNSASWNDVSSKQDNLTFGYDEQDKISAINNSAIAGVGSLDIFPISGTGGVNVYEQNDVLWISGKDFTSDISYISGTIGDVETLLASL